METGYKKGLRSIGKIWHAMPRIGLVSIAVLLALLLAAGPAFSANTITMTGPSAGTRLTESQDFASDTFADPWDMNQGLDAVYGYYSSQITGIGFSDGLMSGKTTGTDASFQLLFAGVGGTEATGRDGAVNKINTGRYDHFSIRMYSSAATSGQLYWFYDRYWGNYGAKSFHIKPGWNVYDIDLGSSSSWQGWPLGFRLDPANTSGVRFKIDWARLHAQRTGGLTNVTWTDSSPGDTAAIWADNDSDPTNGGLVQIGSATSAESNSLPWNVAAVPPGRYWLYGQKGSTTSSSIGPVYINQRPLVTIVKPEKNTGADYATLTGNAWDFSNSTDVSKISGVGGVSFAGGQMSAYDNSGDANVYMRVPSAINSGRFRWLSFRTRYSGGFDYAAGTMARIFWSSTSYFDNRTIQTGNDIVTYPQWTTYVFDMKKMRLDAGSVGWNGWVRLLRYDPLETPPGRTFYMDSVRLSADNASNTKFDIRWTDSRPSSLPTTVSWYYDTDQSGYNGTLIRSVTQVRGTNRVDWNTRSLSARPYYLYFIANDGYSSTRAYTKVPVYVRH